MSARTLMVVVVAGVVAVLPVACGSVALDQKASSNSSASGTGVGGASTSSGSSGSTGGAGGEIGFGGYPDTSGGEAGPGDTPSMPGLFDCGGCLCDGATHYCELQYGLKKSPPPGPPPEPMCPDPADAGANRCNPIPSACLPEATCQCVYPNLGICSCTVAPQGITVLCNLP